jgi:hypothetical protein
MDITTPDEYITKNVIDINVEAVGAPALSWTINDEPASKFHNGEKRITFHIAETAAGPTDIDVAIERTNVIQAVISRRTIQVKKETPKPLTGLDVTRR